MMGPPEEEEEEEGMVVVRSRYVATAAVAGGDGLSFLGFQISLLINQ